MLNISSYSKLKRKKYGFEIDQIKAGKPVNQNNSLLPLTPIYDGRFLRVGGRLRKASIPEEIKHQIILRQKHSITKLLILDRHVKLAHCGTEHLIADIRQKVMVWFGLIHYSAFSAAKAM